MTTSSKNDMNLRWQWLESNDDWHDYEESIHDIIKNEFNKGNLNVKY